MEEDIKQLKQELAQLREEFNQLKNSSSIPLEIDRALSDRLANTFPAFRPSTKTVASESIPVNTAAAIEVMLQCDGFEQRTVAGVARYYPFFT